MTIFDKAQRVFAHAIFFCFHKYIEFNFHRSLSTRDIICECRIFGWKVGEQAVYRPENRKNALPQVSMASEKEIAAQKIKKSQSL